MLAPLLFNTVVNYVTNDSAPDEQPIHSTLNSCGWMADPLALLGYAWLGPMC